MSASYSFCGDNLTFINSFDDKFPRGIHIDAGSNSEKTESKRRQRGWWLSGLGAGLEIWLSEFLSRSYHQLDLRQVVPWLLLYIELDLSTKALII